MILPTTRLRGLATGFCMAILLTAEVARRIKGADPLVTFLAETTRGNSHCRQSGVGRQRAALTSRPVPDSPSGT